MHSWVLNLEFKSIYGFWVFGRSDFELTLNIISFLVFTFQNQAWRSLPFWPCHVDLEHCNFFVSVNLEFLSFTIFNLCALYTSSMYGLHILKVGDFTLISTCIARFFFAQFFLVLLCFVFILQFANATFPYIHNLSITMDK